MGFPPRPVDLDTAGGRSAARRAGGCWSSSSACTRPGIPISRPPGGGLLIGIVGAGSQIRQTEDGADIAAVIDGDFDQAATAAAVERSLRRAGVTCPRVGIRRVGALDRDPMTSKVRRFVPLAARIG